MPFANKVEVVMELAFCWLCFCFVFPLLVFYNPFLDLNLADPWDVNDDSGYLLYMSPVLYFAKQITFKSLLLPYEQVWDS